VNSDGFLCGVRFRDSCPKLGRLAPPAKRKSAAKTICAAWRLHCIFSAQEMSQMPHWLREYSDAEKRLFEARARLAKLAYHRWQVERLVTIDSQLTGLNAARADYEALTRIFNEAKDYHRALRLKLRRGYYALLREKGWLPSDEAGIEAKVHELAEQNGAAAEALGTSLDACEDASVRERQTGELFTRAHVRLRQSMQAALAFVEESLERDLHAREEMLESAH
jgi:hypothetical protein